MTETPDKKIALIKANATKTRRFETKTKKDFEQYNTER
jgi:hypothetical protein